tara:strand:- start:285 stop:1475 length:1191 start_codon:yes stop_codon:yes gene_type:complete
VKICHYASYDANTGDNSTIYGIRKYFEKHSSIKEIKWIKKPNVEAQTLITSSKSENKKIFISQVVEYFRNMKKDEGCDLIVIGGGGQIEDRKRWLTGMTLPFNKEILQEIDIPIACIGLGINYFREPVSFEPKQLSNNAFKNLELLIDKCIYFSIRNDGSYDILKKLFDRYKGSKEIFSKVKEMPDPGLFFEQELPRKTNKEIKNYIFQPAWNSSRRIAAGRGLLGGKGMTQIKELLTKNNNFHFMPHTLKDYTFFTKVDESIPIAISKEDFKKYVLHKQYASFIKDFYFKYDMSVAMRGHGQLNAIAINMPSLYFSTQDKVRKFSLKNEFGDYNIDIQEEGCFEKLNHCTNRMLNDKNYLDEWYEIRDRKMLQFKKQFKDCVQEISQIIDANNKK